MPALSIDGMVPRNAATAIREGMTMEPMLISDPELTTTI
jgi:hypothetical protein